MFQCFFNSSLPQPLCSCKKFDDCRLAARDEGDRIDKINKDPAELEKEQHEFADKSEDMKMFSMDFGRHHRFVAIQNLVDEDENQKSKEQR
jgi:hypothetical protein